MIERCRYPLGLGMCGQPAEHFIDLRHTDEIGDVWASTLPLCDSCLPDWFDDLG